MLRDRFRQCCGCIPARSGVYVIATSSLLEGILGALSGKVGTPASHPVNWVAIGFAYGTLSLISVFGLLSVTKTHRKLVLAYFYLLIPCALFSAVMTLFSIAALCMDRTAYARTCQPPQMQYFPSCRQDLREFRLVPPIAFGVMSLLQTYGCYIVYVHYADLREQVRASVSVADNDSEFYSLDAASPVSPVKLEEDHAFMAL